MLFSRSGGSAVSYLLFIVTVAVSAALYVEAGDFRVAYGSQASARQFPSSAFLFSGKSMCTGTFLAADLVITAGHCMCTEKPMSQVFGGLTNVNQISETYVQSFTVRSFQVLPGYAAACENVRNNIKNGIVQGADIALVRLTPDEVEDPSAVNPITNMPMGEQATTVGTSYTIAGFGKDETGSVGALKTGTVTTMACPWRPDGGLAKAVCHNLKDLAQAQTTLEGDSGGPLLEVRADGSQVLMGVASGKLSLSNGMEFGVHSNIFLNRDAIRAAIDKLYEGEKAPL